MPCQSNIMLIGGSCSTQLAQNYLTKKQKLKVEILHDLKNFEQNFNVFSFMSI